MKRKMSALCVIIVITLLVSACGCLTKHDINDTVHATQAPTSGEPISTPVLTTVSSFACINATPDRTTVGIVTKVVDGDTIHVEIDKTDYTVRYIGIDAPENTGKGERMSADRP